jgi:hypothetical protein
MTYVSTAQQLTEPVDTRRPLCSHIGTLSIHPTVGISLLPKGMRDTPTLSYLLGLDRHASAYYVSK